MLVVTKQLLVSIPPVPEIPPVPAVPPALEVPPVPETPPLLETPPLPVVQHELPLVSIFTTYISNPPAPKEFVAPAMA